MLQSGAGTGLPSGTRVGELVRFVGSLYRAPLSAGAVLGHAGLISLAGRKLGGLSGGELQRVRFALAICANPRLLILDEPTVGFDVPAQRSFWETVRGFAAGGCAVLFATHYLAEAAESAGRVVVRTESQHDVEQDRGGRRGGALSAHRLTLEPRTGTRPMGER